jgi:hypothetical protein
MRLARRDGPPRGLEGEGTMTIEGRRLLELALHVKLASEAMIGAARHLTSLRPTDATAAQAEAWTRTMNELIAMNVELGLMERTLRAVVRDGRGRAPGIPMAVQPLYQAAPFTSAPPRRGRRQVD